MLSNKKGVTLLELIIALAIMSIIMAVCFSVFSYGMKGYQRETANVDSQIDVRYVLNYLNREIRRAEHVEVNTNILKLTDETGNITEYKLNGDEIIKNATTLVDGINTFMVTMNGDKIEIFIESVENSSGDSYELSSEITIRK